MSSSHKGSGVGVMSGVGSVSASGIGIISGAGAMSGPDTMILQARCIPLVVDAIKKVSPG